jgi:hypothetical protein
MQQFERLIHALERARDELAQVSATACLRRKCWSDANVHTERGKRPKHIDVKPGARRTG